MWVALPRNYFAYAPHDPNPTPLPLNHPSPLAVATTLLEIRRTTGLDPYQWLWSYYWSPRYGSVLALLRVSTLSV